MLAVQHTQIRAEASDRLPLHWTWHTDKRVRDRCVKGLRAWLSGRASSDQQLSDLDVMKLWKGLWYCMWMSDKAPVQQELARTYVLLCASARVCVREDFEIILSHIQLYLMKGLSQPSRPSSH